jgi:uncharacterized membrane protein
MYRLAAVTSEGVTWTLRRNCSVTPRQMGAMLGVLAGLSLAVAGFLWSRGAWMVVPFSVLELLAVAVAFLVYARHATDGEQISVSRGRVVVEQERAGALERSEFAGHTVRIEAPEAAGGLVRVCSGGKSVVVGRFVRPDLRPMLARELRWALRDL